MPARVDSEPFDSTASRSRQACRRAGMTDQEASNGASPVSAGIQEFTAAPVFGSLLSPPPHPLTTVRLRRVRDAALMSLSPWSGAMNIVLVFSKFSPYILLSSNIRFSKRGDKIWIGETPTDKAQYLAYIRASSLGEENDHSQLPPSPASLFRLRGQNLNCLIKSARQSVRDTIVGELNKLTCSGSNALFSFTGSAILAKWERRRFLGFCLPSPWRNT